MKAVLGKSALMSKSYHLVKSLFLVLFISFMFPLIFFGGFFWNIHSDVGNLGSDRSYLGYWFNWIMILFWFSVTIVLLHSMFKTVLDPIHADKTFEANYEQPDFEHERNEISDATGELNF